MVVRIGFKLGPGIARPGRSGGRLAPFAASLLTLASVTCLILGLWRLGSDLGFAGPFAVPEGLFSHLYVWLAAAAALQFFSWKLATYGRIADAPGPQAESVPGRAAPEQVTVQS